MFAITSPHFYIRFSSAGIKKLPKISSQMHFVKLIYPFPTLILPSAARNCTDAAGDSQQRKDATVPRTAKPEKNNGG
jgi:hypothetical protein